MTDLPPQLRDLDIALMIFLLALAMFVPDLIEGIHNYRRGRDLARQISREHAARDFLAEDWKRRHG
jgi:hypothetical protein